MQRKIIHIDMDAFYASVEIRDNPELRGKAIAVGGKADSRGVISTCSYEARKYGVHSAMPSAEAVRRCPHLILLPGRMSVYKEVSAQIRAIFARYSDLVEPLSLDEAYLDVTECQACHGSATLIAEQIRAEILAETGLTASAGVAPNKFLAKIASEENKPNGQYVVTPDKAAEFVSALPLRKLPGVGPRTAEKLEQMGLQYGRDILSWSLAELSEKFGKFGHSLYQRARGIDERPVQPSRVRKSVGVETTLAQDLRTEAQCSAVLNGLLPELIQRLRGRPFKGLTIKLKFHDFQQTTAAGQADRISADILDSILHTAWQRAAGRRVRLVGISVSLSEETQIKQLSLDL
ncbi:DNA polymerase IV [Marinobacterium zhoushanense]|uniref:DNA polymerase IV n=1 Tax=Marinobacterium zhoushanense TaxID=1679163 RepID=A0ABQ1K7P0_9GAMM|nr:DNA polymerase IV [Marinobacterium zhoushanense]GGB85989.1 DNA polymerase IV [Marinobacterium zhoushanense]